MPEAKERIVHYHLRIMVPSGLHTIQSTSQRLALVGELTSGTSGVTLPNFPLFNRTTKPMSIRLDLEAVLSSS